MVGCRLAYLTKEMEGFVGRLGRLPLRITGFALQIFSKLSGTETDSPDPTVGEEAGPTKAGCGKDARLPPSKILDTVLLESDITMISSNKSYSTSSHAHAWLLY